MDTQFSLAAPWNGWQSERVSEQKPSQRNRERHEYTPRKHTLTLNLVHVGKWRPTNKKKQNPSDKRQQKKKIQHTVWCDNKWNETETLYFDFIVQEVQWFNGLRFSSFFAPVAHFVSYWNKFFVRLLLLLAFRRALLSRSTNKMCCTPKQMHPHTHTFHDTITESRFQSPLNCCVCVTQRLLRSHANCTLFLWTDKYTNETTQHSRQHRSNCTSSKSFVDEKFNLTDSMTLDFFFRLSVRLNSAN